MRDLGEDGRAVMPHDRGPAAQMAPGVHEVPQQELEAAPAAEEGEVRRAAKAGRQVPRGEEAVARGLEEGEGRPFGSRNSGSTATARREARASDRPRWVPISK